MNAKTQRAIQEAIDDRAAHIARVVAVLADRAGGVISVTIDEIDALHAAGDVHLDCAYDPDQGYLFSVVRGRCPVSGKTEPRA